MSFFDCCGFCCFLPLLSCSFCFEWLCGCCFKPKKSFPDIDAAKKLAMKSFKEDPMSHSLFGKQTLTKGLPEMFDSFGFYAASEELVTVNEDGNLAGFIWYPQMTKVALYGIRFLRRFFCRTLEPMFCWRAYVMVKLFFSLDEDHGGNNLEIVVVSADLRGRGIGSRLMKKYLGKEGGKNHSLVSSNPRNVSFYKKNGFEVIKEVEFLGSRLTSMHKNA